MTCNGCRSHVEKSLASVEGVREVEVNLERGEAQIEMDSHIPTTVFEEKLQEGGGNYHILSPEDFKNQHKMVHTYPISGMTCNGCRSHVEETLSKVEGVTSANVNLEKAEAKIEMERHIPLKEFENALQQAGGNYHIHKPGEEVKKSSAETEKPKNKEAGNGIWYCPMHCEGDKTYNKPGDCPVCGMDLVEQVSAVPRATK